MAWRKSHVTRYFYDIGNFSDIVFYFIICFVMFGYLSADITIEAKDGIGFCFMETKGGAISMEMKKVNGRIRFIQKLYGKCTTY